MQTSPTPSTSRFAFERLLLLPQRDSFSPREVRQRLLEDDTTDPRTAAVHAAAAQTAIWSSLLPDKVAFDLGRAALRLPSIVYWYRQGLPAHEIGRRVSPFGGSWDANRALDVAAALIAQSLNQLRSEQKAA